MVLRSTLLALLFLAPADAAPAAARVSEAALQADPDVKDVATFAADVAATAGGACTCTDGEFSAAPPAELGSGGSFAYAA